MKENRYDILTDKNLNFINNGSGEKYYHEFINENNNLLFEETEASKPISDKNLAEYMEYDCGVINCNGEVCTISKKGHDVLDNGGWLNYKKNESKRLMKEKQENTQPITFNTINVSDSNIGQINQESKSKNSPINLKANNKSNSASFLMKILKNRYIIGIILIAIEEITLGTIWKYLYSLFNEYISF